MVKVECPGHKENILWDTGLKVGDYYYLLNQTEDKIIQMELDTDDGVLFTCDNDKNYTFLDEVLDPVSGSYSIKGKLDIASQSNGHRMSRTDNHLIVTSYNEYSEPYPVGVQLINDELEIVNSYNWHTMDGVAWDGNKIFVLVKDLIFIFDNNLEPIETAGITSIDDSSCIVKDGCLS